MEKIANNDPEASSERPRWWLRQAVSAFDRRRYRLASWLSSIAVHRNPYDYFALCKYAESLHHLGHDHDRKAATMYKRAIGVNPTHPLAHRGLGLIHYTNAKRINAEYSMLPGGAEAMFMDEKEPGEEYRLDMSYADFHVGNRKMAIMELEEAARLTSSIDDKVRLLDLAADVYCIMDIAAGIAAYKRILEIAHNDVPVHYYLAMCYAESYRRRKESPPGDYDRRRFRGNDKLAIQEYKFVRDNDPDLASDLEPVLARCGIETPEGGEA